ncbi:hypothetical protein Goari_011534, partial [Gossypium aridum]|nr:hypothetical protein [Gossypium aridum]
MARRFGNFIGTFLDYDTKSIKSGYRAFLWIHYEQLPMLCFLCGHLGDSEAFYLARVVGFERRGLFFKWMILVGLFVVTWKCCDYRECQSQSVFGGRGCLDGSAGEQEIISSYLLALVDRVARCHETPKLECLRVGELSGSTVPLIYIEEAEHNSDGFRGGLALCWKGTCQIHLCSFSSSHIDVFVEDDYDSNQLCFTSFYGSPMIVDAFTRGISFGGRLCDERCLVDFCTILEKARLFDLGFFGQWFSWERGKFPHNNISERLDKGHGNRTFQFEDTWLLEDSCEVEECLHSLLTADSTDDALDEMVLTRMHLNFEIDKAERYWEQWAWDNWLRHGGRNTTFFHRHVSHRHRVNAIDHIIVADRIMVEGSKEIERVACHHFAKLFMSQGLGDMSRLLLGIMPSITDDMSTYFCSNFSADEVHLAVQGMAPTKVAGSD